VRLERLRDFGDVWLGLGLWRLLGLDKLLSEKIPNGREEVPWHVVAAILTLGRFCEPSSELHIEDTWYERTALEDLLGVSPDKVHTDRLYAGLDCLLSHKEAAEKHLKERLGRIRQRYWRASDAFNVKITSIDNPADKAGLKVTFERNKKWNDWNELSEGCYLLRTNLIGVDPQTLWKQYIQLTGAEWAFRITKDELVIRPIWHHKSDRVRTHILICFLAYVLWKSLAQWMKRSGLGEAPRTLLEEFSRIKSGDIVLSTLTRADLPKKTIRLRCVTMPDEAQKILLSRLGLTLPKRLQRIDEIAQM
jgi:hypothetical protein